MNNSSDTNTHRTIHKLFMKGQFKRTLKKYN